MVYDKYASNDKYDTFIHVCVKECSIKKEIYDLCNKIFDSKISYDCDTKDKIEQVINYVKTIFKDYEITGMIIHLKSRNDYTSVTIKNNQVIKFEKKVMKDFGQLNFNYDENGIKLNTDNNDFNELSNQEEEFNNLFNQSMKTIKRINRANLLQLEGEKKQLISIYKEFFNKYPNLSNKDEYLKIQPMMWLVSRSTNLKNKQIFEDYTAKYNGKLKSYQLKIVTDEIVPYGQTNEKMGIDIDEENAKIINDIGSIVNDYISRYKNEQEILDNIATTSFIIDRLVTKYYEVEDIVSASKGNLNYEQVEEILEFIHNLDTSLQSDNPYDTYKKLEKKPKVKVKNNG